MFEKKFAELIALPHYIEGPCITREDPISTPAELAYRASILQALVAQEGPPASDRDDFLRRRIATEVTIAQR